jgi:hypothetical protein
MLNKHTYEYEIGFQYLEQKNVSAALPHLQKAALGGHSMAHLWLESLYNQGLQSQA